MYPEDYPHPLFSSATPQELKQHLDALYDIYEPEQSNQAFRILRRLQHLARAGKGLRIDTKYGLGSYYDSPRHQPDIVRVRFDGDFSSTGVGLSSIKSWWFEME